METRCRDVLVNGVQESWDTDAFFRRHTYYFLVFIAEYSLDLRTHTIHVRDGKIDFVYDREHDKVIVPRKIVIGHCLCLDTLRCIYDQKHTLARTQRSGHLISEIHVSRRVDEVE